MGRMEQIIDEIENYIEGCKAQAFSSGEKIVVNREELMDMIHELKLKTPDELRKYQQIISNREAILSDAQAKADAIIAEAQVQTNELISEHEIMQQAYAQANEVVMVATSQAQELLDNATIEANNIRSAAVAYTDDLLKKIEAILTHSIDTSRARYDNLTSSLQSTLDVVTANRMELAPVQMENERNERSVRNDRASAAEQQTAQREANQVKAKDQQAGSKENQQASKDPKNKEKNAADSQ